MKALAGRTVTGLIVSLLLFVAAGSIIYRKQHPSPEVATSPVKLAPPPANRVVLRPPPSAADPSAADAPTTPSLPPATPVLTEFAKQPVESKSLSLTELAEQFPEFLHKPFGMAGFDPVVLPFRYHDPQNVGDRSEANALSFLLSDALDWAPGNYCKRHAYFIFKRSQEQMQPLASKYDPQVIQDLIHYWIATHAIGGVLTRTSAGCSGALEIYGRDGRLAFTKPYTKPESYSDLLGDMAVDAMTFFHEPPNHQLASYLHQPRCQHEESIIRLGLAAFAPERSPQEFKLYTDILAEDPDFAEVRYWWANQGQWSDQNGGVDLDLQTGLSLQSRLTVSALQTFDPVQCSDRRLAEQLPRWRQQAAAMMGPDAPVAQEWIISDLDNRRRDNPAAFARALEIASRYPNDRNLVIDLIYGIFDGVAGVADLPTAASLCVCAMSDRYQNAEGDRHESAELLGQVLLHMGRADLASSFLPRYPAKSSWELYETVKSLTDAGRFADAVSYFNDHSANLSHDSEAIVSADDAAVAAVASQDGPALVSLRKQWAEEFRHDGVSALLDDLQDAVNGQGVDPQQLFTDCVSHMPEEGNRERVLLACQADLVMHHRRLLGVLWQCACLQPQDRLYWVVLDGYQQQAPVLETPAFYRSLQWMFPDDPWVAAAAKAWRARARAAVHGNRAPAQPLEINDGQPPPGVLAALNDFSPDPLPRPDHNVLNRVAAQKQGFTVDSPWVVADTIHGLLVHHQTDAARDAALRYQHLAVEIGTTELRAWGARIVRLTQPPAE